MADSISLVYMGISTIVFIVAIYLTLRSIGKEKPVTRNNTIFSIIVQIVFLAVYSVLAKITYSTFLLGALGVGLLVGLIVGGASHVYRKKNRIFTKRRKIFFVFWAASIVLNQLLISFGFVEGLVLMIFSTGNMVGSEGNILFRIFRAKPAVPPAIAKPSTIPEKLPVS